MLARCAFVLLILAESAWAQGYLGFNLGKANYRGACEGAAAGITCDNGDGAFKLLAGYQFTPIFALEFGYGDLGTVSANTGESVELAGADMSAIASWPIANRFAVHGRLGVYYGSMSGTATIPVAVDNTTPCPAAPPGAPPPPPCHPTTFSPPERGWRSGNNTDITYGLGLSYEMADNTFARLEWQRYKNLGGSGGPKIDVDLFSFGAVFRF